MDQFRKITLCLFASLCSVLLASCSSHNIRGQSPFIQVNSIRLQAQSLSLDLGVRNVNTEAIMIEHIEFSVTLDDTSLAIFNAASQASVIANGMENLRFELAASPEGIALLNALERGERNNLEYSIEGVLQVSDNLKMKVKRLGHIYPVPGRPGHFR
jgi:LEA14-like dessication related protein